MRWATVFRSGSMRISSRRSALATQTDPSPTATASIPGSRAIVEAVGLRPLGSTRQSSPAAESVIHTERVPTARRARPVLAMGTRSTTCSVTGSIRASPPGSRAQSPSGPKAMATARTPDVRAVMLPSRGSRREIAKSAPTAKTAERVTTMCCREAFDVSARLRSRPVVTSTEPLAASSLETAVTTGPTNWESVRDPSATQSAPFPATRSMESSRCRTFARSAWRGRSASACRRRH